MIKLKSAAYRDLISDIADLEPVHGWQRSSDLPELSGDDIVVVLAERQQDVSDETAIDTALIARLYQLDRALADAAIASHIRAAIERACREAIWPDVHGQCETNNEARYERQCEQYYGGAAPVTQREQLARDYGVAALLK